MSVQQAANDVRVICDKLRRNRKASNSETMRVYIVLCNDKHEFVPEANRLVLLFENINKAVNEAKRCEATVEHPTIELRTCLTDVPEGAKRVVWRNPVFSGKTTQLKLENIDKKFSSGYSHGPFMLHKNDIVNRYGPVPMIMEFDHDTHEQKDHSELRKIVEHVILAPGLKFSMFQKVVRSVVLSRHCAACMTTLLLSLSTSDRLNNFIERLTARMCVPQDKKLRDLYEWLDNNGIKFKIPSIWNLVPNFQIPEKLRVLNDAPERVSADRNRSIERDDGAPSSSTGAAPSAAQGEPLNNASPVSIPDDSFIQQTVFENRPRPKRVSSTHRKEPDTFSPGCFSIISEGPTSSANPGPSPSQSPQSPDLESSSMTEARSHSSPSCSGSQIRLTKNQTRASTPEPLMRIPENNRHEPLPCRPGEREAVKRRVPQAHSSAPPPKQSSLAPGRAESLPYQSLSQNELRATSSSSHCPSDTQLRFSDHTGIGSNRTRDHNVSRAHTRNPSASNSTGLIVPASVGRGHHPLSLPTHLHKRLAEFGTVENYNSSSRAISSLSQVASDASLKRAGASNDTSSTTVYQPLALSTVVPQHQPADVSTISLLANVLGPGRKPPTSLFEGGTPTLSTQLPHHSQNRPIYSKFGSFSKSRIARSYDESETSFNSFGFGQQDLAQPTTSTSAAPKFNFSFSMENALSTTTTFGSVSRENSNDGRRDTREGPNMPVMNHRRPGFYEEENDDCIILDESDQAFPENAGEPLSDSETRNRGDYLDADGLLSVSPFAIKCWAIEKSKYWPFIDIRSIDCIFLRTLDKKAFEKPRLLANIKWVLASFHQAMVAYRDAFIPPQGPLTVDNVLELVEKCSSSIFSIFHVPGIIQQLAPLFLSNHVHIDLDFDGIDNFKSDVNEYFKDADEAFDESDLDICVNFLLNTFVVILVDFIPFVATRTYGRTFDPVKSLAQSIPTDYLSESMANFDKVDRELIVQSVSTTTLWTIIPADHGEDNLLKYMFDEGLVEMLRSHQTAAFEYLSEWMKNIQKKMRDTLRHTGIRKTHNSYLNRYKHPTRWTRERGHSVAKFVMEILFEVLLNSQPLFEDSNPAKLFCIPWRMEIMALLDQKWNMLNAGLIDMWKKTGLEESTNTCRINIASLFSQSGQRVRNYADLLDNTVDQIHIFIVTLALEALRHFLYIELDLDSVVFQYSGHYEGENNETTRRV